MRRALQAVLVALTVATVAQAVVKGDTLFIKARNTSLKSGPEPTADVVAILQPGSTVTYVGPASKGRGWHEVSAGSRRGFVSGANLSTQKPSTEIVYSNGMQTVDPQAFVSSGAATKALGEGAINYGTSTKPDLARAVKDIQAAERIAKGVGDPELAKHERDAKLHVMVGEAGGTP